MKKNRFNLIFPALLTIAALLTGQSTRAQSIDYTAEIGSGTSLYHLLPTADNWKYSLTQQIYMIDEILRAGTINTISFYANQAFDGDMHVQVYMKQVSKNSFANSSDVEAVTASDKVFEGAFHPTSQGWVTITLDTPFNYDATSNLLICFYDNTGNDWHASNTNFKFRYSTYDTNMALGWRSDSSAPDLNDLSSFSGQSPNGKELFKYRSNIKLGFTNSEPISALPRPSGINYSVIPGNGSSAALSWKENGSATAWQLCLNDDTEHLIDATTNPYTLTGLTAGTAYSVKVRSVNGTEHSNWSGAISFTPSAVSAYTLTVNKGSGSFENIVVDGYSIEENSSYCQFIMPASQLSLISNSTIGKMTFYSSDSYSTVSWGDARFKVYLAEVDQATFTSTDYYDWENLDEVYLGSLSVASNKMEIVFDTPYQYRGGNLLVAVKQFVAGTDSFLRWKVATVLSSSLSNGVIRNLLPETTFEYTPGISGTYTKPSGLSVSNIDSDKADVSWTSGASVWQIRVNDDKVNLIDVSTNPYSLTNLSCLTDYRLNVRADYGGGHYSHWSPSATFKTAEACARPTDLSSTTTPGSGTVATLSWTENENSTQWAICLDDDETNLIVADSNPFTLTGLTPYHTYKAMVRAVCDKGYSNWSNTTTFTPESISELNINYTGGTSVEVTWVSNDATTFDIDLNGTTTENVTQPYALTGLVIGTAYQVKVRTRNGNDVGNWSNTVSFTAYSMQTISYIDVDGQEKSVSAKELTGSETTLYDGWYVVAADIFYDHYIWLSSDNVRIILADGATMSIGSSGTPLSNNSCIDYSSSNTVLSIYGQAGGTGAMNLYSNHFAINVPTIYIYGGQITASSGANDFAGIRSMYNVNIYGGNVSSIGAHGISSGIINLGWMNTADRITSTATVTDGESYHLSTIEGALSIKDGQYLYNGTEVLSGAIADLTKLQNVTLQPAVKITLPEGVSASGTNVFNQTDGTYALPGATITLGAATGYTVSDYSSTDVTINESEGVYTFTMPASDVTVSATVSQNESLDLTANAATLSSLARNWCTFYHPSLNYSLPYGAQAFTMKSDKGLYLVGDGSVIPADTPVVIMSDAAAITLTKIDATTVAAESGNILQGTAVETLRTGLITGSQKVYVLGKVGDEFGFYEYTGDEIPANKAYYVE